MKHIALGLLLTAMTVQAEEDVHSLVRGKFGDRTAFVGARGLYSFGTNGFLPSSPRYTQSALGLTMAIGFDALPNITGQRFSTYNTLLGFEAELVLGAMQNEVLSDGTFYDSERKLQQEAVWSIMGEFHLRGKLSPLAWTNGEFAVRASLTGGVAVELSFGRYEGVPIGWTLGAEVLVALEGKSLTLGWVFLPGQGSPFTVSRHTFSAHLALGPVLVGFKAHLLEATTTLGVLVPNPGPLQSTGLEGLLGYVF